LITAPRHILITGASSGIGAALALYYAQNAAHEVTLSLCGRVEGRLENIAAQCRAVSNANLVTVHTKIIDVTDQSAMRTWILARDAARPLDLIIANAGISGGTAGFAHYESDHQVRRIFDVNLGGVLNSIEPVLPAMVARGRGQIGVVSSLASFSGWPGAPSYSASKVAVRLYAEGLRGSLHGSGVSVHSILPGFIKTPLTDINPYKMPFLMSADKAAGIIAKALAKGKGRIAFPWTTYLLSGFIGLLPFWLSSRLLLKAPKKP